MNSDRIKEIQETTAYPESRSVLLALNQVWNECEQEKVKNLTIPVVSVSFNEVIDFVENDLSMSTDDYTREELYKKFNER